MNKELTEGKMIQKINLKDSANSIDELFRYKRVGTLNNHMLSVLQAENRRVEPWALKTLSYLCHPLREEQAVKYIRPALDSLPYIQRTSDIFFPMNWTRTLLGRFRSPDALEEVEKFLADNPDFPPLLKSKVLQASWSLQRRNKAN